MPDPELLRAAIAASGLSQVGFAELLRRQPSTIWRWLTGARPVDPTVGMICDAIIRDPRIVASLAPPP